MDDGESTFQIGGPLSASDPRECGPYELVRRLGSGSMGRVYLGVRLEGVEEVHHAVKILRSEWAEDPQFRRRFARELRLARRVHGERVAAVIDGDPDAEAPWIASEVVAGRSVQATVDADGPWDSARTRALARDIAEALATIHRTGVVHRDLKPSNVLLGPDGPKVIDFGVARAADTTVLTVTGQAMGTPAYMAPEQAESTGFGPPLDVFALGAVLAFVLSGRPAFGTGTPAAIVHRVVYSEPDLTGVAEDDPQLRTLIAFCLAKDPGARPTPEQIIEICDGRPVPRVYEDSLSAPTIIVAVPASGLDGAATTNAATGVAASHGSFRRKPTLLALAASLVTAGLVVLIANLTGGGSGHATAATHGSSHPGPGDGSYSLFTPGPTSADSSAQSSTAAPGAPAGTGSATSSGASGVPALPAVVTSGQVAPSTGPASTHSPAPVTTPPRTTPPSTKPSPPPPTKSAPPPWTQTDGSSCGNGMSLNNGTKQTWSPVSGSAMLGCGDGSAVTDSSGGGSATASWSFDPGTGKSCTFTIYIANDSQISVTNANYSLGFGGQGLPSVDQAAHIGGSVTLTAPTTTSGTYDLVLSESDFDLTPGTEYAGAVTLTCR